MTLAVEGLRIFATEEGGRELVAGVSFTLAAGEALCMLGESGSGKTLVAQAVMGTLAPELRAEGRIWLDGRDVLALPPRERRALWGRRLALLPQEPWLALDPTMRALPQVAEVHALVRGTPWAAARQRAASALSALGLAPQAQGRFPHQLSGGMCQRVALATAQAAEAPLLLADEPTKGLDAALRDGVAERLRAEVGRGRALLAITHDIRLAELIGDRVLVMLEGRVVEAGASGEVLHAPRHDYTRALLAAAPERWPERPAAAAGDPLLAARGLAKRFGSQPVLRGLDFELAAGERVALLGPSGCGKSTLGNLLIGLLRPDAGTVWRAPRLPRLAFQKLYQDPAAAFAPRQKLGRGLADLRARHGIAEGVLDSLLHRLRLPRGLLARRPDQVSGGELQRLALARVLALDPAFLFADEPTSRLDPIIQQEVMALLLDVADDRGLALLLVTHEPALAARSAGRVVDLSPAAPA